MGMDAKQLKDLIISPSIKDLDLYSEAAVNLLAGTAAQETNLGKYLIQLKGIALGIYQMEPPTHQDLWVNFINPNPNSFLMKLICPETIRIDHVRLIYDLKYATQMARLQYYRVPEALPDKDDLLGLATYWKRYWNTHEGKGTIDQFVENYKRYVTC